MVGEAGTLLTPQRLIPWASVFLCFCYRAKVCCPRHVGAKSMTPASEKRAIYFMPSRLAGDPRLGRQEPMLTSFSLIWGLDKASGLGRMLVRQVLIGEFWNLGDYGIGSGAGERKPRGILIRPSWVGRFSFVCIWFGHRRVLIGRNSGFAKGSGGYTSVTSVPQTGDPWFGAHAEEGAAHTVLCLYNNSKIA